MMAAKILCGVLVLFCLSYSQVAQAGIAQFKLFTPGRRSPETISAKNLGRRFNPSQKLAFIIHGYIHNGQLSWIAKMRAELMRRERRNIVVVDWGRGARDLLYPIAVLNTRVVGAEIAALIQRLHRRYNYDLSKIHVIGHSLGAHVAGFAGAKVQALLAGKKLGRITGLDPARPSFEHNNFNGRLDPSDARFVDVIHTNIGTASIGLGLARPCGHVDFYPNGGNDQPGCYSSDLSSLQGMVSSSLGVLKNTIPLSPQTYICDHLKVLTFFTASINNNCSRKAFPCGNWQDFKQGCCTNCRGACAEMGYNADQRHHGRISKTSRKFYLKTSNSYPYCAPKYSYYHVTLHGLRVSSGGFLFSSSVNQIKIKLHGQHHGSVTTKPSNVKSGTFSTMIASNIKLGTLRHISISYMGSTSMYVGRVTVNGPQYKYRADYYKRLSSGKSFFFIPRFRAFKRSLRKVN